MKYTDNTIMDMIYSVDPETRLTGAFVCDHDTAMHLRQIKDTDGRYAWHDGWDKTQPPLLFGYPVYADERFAGLAFGPFKPLPARVVTWTKGAPNDHT